MSRTETRNMGTKVILLEYMEDTFLKIGEFNRNTYTV